MFHLIPFIQAIGYIGVFGVIFLECGLLIGFFLPGDTLLFAAGLLAAQGYFSISLLLFGTFIAGAAGYTLGYWIGRKIGQTLFVREDSFFFKRANALRAQKFFEKYGKKTILLSWYTPVIRTFAPVIAGVAEMKYRTFLAYNLIGAALWSLSVGLLGYFLGARVPNIDAYLLPIVLLVLVVSFIPVIREIFLSRRAKKDIPP